MKLFHMAASLQVCLTHLTIGCHPNAGVTVTTIGNPGITAMATLVERSHEQLMMS